MSYHCIVGQVRTRPHPNADRVQLGTICGEQVVIGFDVDDGQLMLYFPCDGQLSEGFAKANNLISYKDPETGERKGGFFGKNRRVRAQNFRGARSHGFAIELESVDRVGCAGALLVEGDTFDCLGDVPICNKYITPATRKAANAVQAKPRRRRNLLFPEHVDTSQLAHNMNKLPTPGIWYVTEKLHGTSARYGMVRETYKPWWSRVLRLKAVRHRWVSVTGSRRVVLRGEGSHGYHGNNAFRYRMLDPSALRLGEIVYGEIVGDSSDGRSIMRAHDSAKLGKAFQYRFGKQVSYNYGCPAGECRFYVYRICVTGQDGIVRDLSWPQVKVRAERLGLECVLESPFELVQPIMAHSPEESRRAAEAILEDYKKAWPSVLGGMAEGIVVRVEHGDGASFYKHKNYEFKVLEGIIKDADDYVDEEEIS